MARELEASGAAKPMTDFDGVWREPQRQQLRAHQDRERNVGLLPGPAQRTKDVRRFESEQTEAGTLGEVDAK